MSEPSKAIPRLDLKGITKQFPGCLANDTVDLTLMPGEIHALLGENGAGKSTLVKIIYGVLHADKGSMAWNGEIISVGNPAQARNLGIGMVFQHFSLFDSLTVVENIALALDDKISLFDLSKKIETISEKYGLPLEPARHVHTLSVGERQRVEIVRCLLQNPRLLIMDEPTSVLTPQEATKLFETLRRLSDEGVSILYISHKLDEIKALCSAATVLRAGKVSGHCDPRVEDTRSMAQMMIGESLKTPEVDRSVEAGDTVLAVHGLSMAANNAFGTSLKSVSLDVRAGEIVGIAGVAGNGQNTLLAALSGEMLCADEDAVSFMGAPFGRVGARERRSAGLCYVPEERLGHGAVPAMTLSENAMLSGHIRKELLKFGKLFMHKAKSEDYAKKVIEDYDVMTRDHHSQAGSLSGGNLQKFILGREIMQDPKVLILAHPTWGVDAGAAASIHQALMDLKAKGAAILVVSQDLDELFTLSDRMAVICDGELSESQPVHALSVEQVGLMMGGLFDEALKARGEYHAS